MNFPYTRYVFAIWVNNGCEFAAINSGIGFNPGDSRVLAWEDTTTVLPLIANYSGPNNKSVWLKAR